MLIYRNFTLQDRNCQNRKNLLPRPVFRQSSTWSPDLSCNQMTVPNVLAGKETDQWKQGRENRKMQDNGSDTLQKERPALVETSAGRLV